MLFSVYKKPFPAFFYGVSLRFFAWLKTLKLTPCHYYVDTLWE